MAALVAMGSAETAGLVFILILHTVMVVGALAVAGCGGGGGGDGCGCHCWCGAGGALGWGGFEPPPPPPGAERHAAGRTPTPLRPPGFRGPGRWAYGGAGLPAGPW